MSIEILKKKILHRSCYRGCKEMDALLGKFAIQELDNLSADELQSFDLLLEQNDPDIYDWIMHKKSIANPLITKIVAKISSFHNL